MEDKTMKKLLITLILALALAGVFRGTHIHNDREAALSINKSYMSNYPNIPEVVVTPMTTIPF
jgi:hypothetical protein